MGRDKALVEVGGRPLAAVAAAALRGAGAEVVLAIGGDSAALACLGLEPVADRFPGEGPLGGILSALAHARTEVVMVLSCDLPAASAEAVRRVVATLAEAPGAGCAVPVVDGHLQPMHGAWRRSALPVLEAAFGGGERAVHRVLEGVGGVAVAGIDPASLADADTPFDLGQNGPR